MSKQTYESERKKFLAQQLLILKIRDLIDGYLKADCKGHQAELRLIKGDAIKDGYNFQLPFSVLAYGFCQFFVGKLA